MEEPIKPSILTDATLPVEGGVNDKKKAPAKILTPGTDSQPGPVLNEQGQEKFARRPNEIVTLDPEVTKQFKVVIPPIYYWEDVDNGKSVMMTMAFKWRGINYGMSFPIEGDNFVRISMDRKKLFQIVKETLDVLVHHGESVLDQYGQIDPRLVNDQEAIRWKYDSNWDKKVAAFNQLVRIKPITKRDAIKFGLLDRPSGFEV